MVSFASTPAKPKQKRLPDATLYNVDLIFKNFSGKAGKFNGEGERSFGVKLDDDIAEQMVQDGWAVKYLTAREEGDTDQAWLKVKMNFNGKRPPQLVMINSRGRTTLGEDEAMIFDWAQADNIDLILNPYPYDFNGKTGITAYLVSIFVTIKENDLDRKYADVPDAPDSAASGRRYEPNDDDGQTPF